MTAALKLELDLIRVASLLERDPGAAAREAAQILRVHPGHAQALLLLASAHRAAGDPSAATATLAELADAQPDSAVIRLELGRALRAAGRETEAQAALQRAVTLAPDLAEAWRELSLLHAGRGDGAACDAAYAQFERLVPEQSRHSEAAAALANGRLDAAEALLKRALEQSSQDAGARRLLAQVAATRGDYVEAERLLAECLRLAPGYSRARLDLVQVLSQQDKGGPMLPLLERLLAAEPGNERYRSLQAVAYNLLGHTQRALGIFAELVRELPQSEEVWLNYGHVLRAAGRTPEAIDAYHRCLEIKPEFANPWAALANLKTYRFGGSELAAMQAQLARDDLRHPDRVLLEFALGKALEDGGDFAASFEHYARGNALRQAVVAHRSDAVTRYVERTRALYRAEFLAARSGSGSQSAAPIFIVGLPRSGSTLLEQILASHSRVEGTRELSEVLRLAAELGDREEEPGKPATYPQSVARLTPAELTALGERYLEQTRAHRLLGRPHFIDKMGSNFLHIGLIHLMLPNARIIDARRAPLACCFANFKQLFARGAWFTYSLEDLGRYYRDYVSLMTHFDQVLPGRIHRVHYEHVVRDLEGEVRRLLEYCGLPFEERCLRFHETQRAVHTVSSEQVRRPLFTEGLEQWRNFEPWLGPLREALGDSASEAAGSP